MAQFVDVAPSIPAGVEGAAAARKLDRGAFSWASYQGFRDPYMGLVAGFIFMPYLATVLIPDPVEGQAAVATIGKISGLLIAILAPLLGAMVDSIGPRKPGLAICTILMVPLIAGLWFAAPDGSGLSVPVVMAMLTVIGVLFALGEVLFASMLPSAVPPHQRAYASGLALSLGNVTSFVLTAFILLCFALPGTVPSPFLPDAPLLGLSHALNEPDRIVGPVVAIAFALGALPLFLFTRDAPRKARVATGGSSIRAAFSGLFALVKEARQHRDVMTYLVVRTVSQDAGMVLLSMGGVYTAGVMGWGAVEMLVYGLLATIAGMAAGLFAGWLDTAIGPKRALQIEIMGTLVTLIGMLGTSATSLLFLWEWPADAVPQLWNAPIFATVPEVGYIVIAFVGFIFQLAAWASARTLLAHLAPPDRVGAFFGLGAFAAAMTGWVGPLLVGIFTSVFVSQRAGMVPVAILLALGWAGLFLVKGGGRPLTHETI